jgi:hypothetical protein
MHRLFLVLTLLSITAAAVVQPSYGPAKLVDIQHKTRQRTDLYIVNTPVGTEVPYFEVTVQIDQMTYLAEYTPRHSDEQLPDAWVPGAEIQARVEKHFLFLKRSDGSELKWIITKKVRPAEKKD